jgi:hypothetical protein
MYLFSIVHPLLRVGLSGMVVIRMSSNNIINMYGVFVSGKKERERQRKRERERERERKRERERQRIIIFFSKIKSDSKIQERMNVLVIGGGGREHALCWALAQSPSVSKIYITPGSSCLLVSH